MKILLVMSILISPVMVFGDQSTRNAGPKSFYTIPAGTCTGCAPMDFSATFNHTTLSNATGTVSFDVRSWGNFDNAAYVQVTVGGSAITSSNATCNPSNCQFFKNGSSGGFGPAPNNFGSFTVPASFFNSKLNGGSTLQVIHTIIGDNTCIATVSGSCNSPHSDGDQTSIINWTPGACSSPPDECCDLSLYFAPVVNSCNVNGLALTAATTRRSKSLASIHRRLAR